MQPQPGAGNCGCGLPQVGPRMINPGSTTTNPVQLLDRYYNDKRGIRVHVIGYDSATGQVIFRREDYEHDCSVPIRRFRKEYKAVV
ncbi:DUF4222 domain-containing protein [Yersinia hibernica]|nr:DUF4222 domain-containing protein [Yersinia hibernica]